MKPARRLSIVAHVSLEERAIVVQAADLIQKALTEVDHALWACDCDFPEKGSLNIPRSAQPSEHAEVVLFSLLPEVLEMAETDWRACEKRLVATITSLAEGRDESLVFLCTVLRQIGSHEPGILKQKLRRTRELNLFATEISRQLRIGVLDIDRAIADVGSKRLETDYRLTGPKAKLIASHFTAHTLLGNLPEAAIPFKFQDAGRALLAAQRAGIIASLAIPSAPAPKRHLISLTKGNRRQTISPVIHGARESYSGLIIHQVLRGGIRPSEAFNRLIKAVRRRGIRESSAIIARGISTQLKWKR